MVVSRSRRADHQRCEVGVDDREAGLARRAVGGNEDRDRGLPSTWMITEPMLPAPGTANDVNVSTIWAIASTLLVLAHRVEHGAVE